MYLEHFGLTELPFGITPDTSFVFSAAAHQEALNTLLVAMQGGEGFIKVTAEVGTGKTLLCRRFLACLGDNHAVAYIPNPALPPDILLQAVAEEIGLDTDASATEEERFKLVKFINARLLQLAQEGKTLVLCIDEAQTIPIDSLEMLRLLSNLETEKRKLIHIVLFGQPELDEKLSDPSVRQLRQRIAFHYNMPGLRRDEVEHYLAHRLRVAGYRGNPIFSSGVAKKIHTAARGTPRLINILAHKSMLSAFGEGKAQVGGAHVTTAARDTEGARRPFWPF